MVKMKRAARKGGTALAAATLAVLSASAASAQDGAPPEDRNTSPNAGMNMPSTEAAATPPIVEWSPLKGSNFGQELTARWIPVPNGSSGAPRQGWLATADGFFTREAHLAYDYTSGNTVDAHEGLARFNYPLTRRLWAGLQVPFYQNVGNRSRRVDGFGDVTLTTQVMLVETRNVSLNTGVGWRLPTGARRLGNGVFSPQPQVNLWTDIGSGFSLRGRVAYEFPDRNNPDAFVFNAAIGQTITPHARAPLGDFTYYVAANLNEPTVRGARTFFSITPGLRTHLGGNLFLLGAVEFPVTDTRYSFKERYIVQLVQGF